MNATPIQEQYVPFLPLAVVVEGLTLRYDLIVPFLHLVVLLLGVPSRSLCLLLEPWRVENDSKRLNPRLPNF